MIEKLSFFILIIFIVTFVNCYDLFPALPLAIKQDKDSLCSIESEKYLNSLKNYSLWAYEMFDSTGKIPNGILRGNYENLGNFRQCLLAQAPFPTKFCIVTITAKIPQTTFDEYQFSYDFAPNEHVLHNLYDYKTEFKRARNKIHLGWCIPASCSENSIESYLNTQFGSFNRFENKNISFGAKILPRSCQTSHQRRVFDSLDYSFCIVTGILMVLVIAASLWESYFDCNNQIKRTFMFKIFLAFSAIRNWKKLTKSADSIQTLNILYGIRIFSITVMVIGHTFLFELKGGYNFDLIEKLYPKLWTTLSIRIDLFVDTMFFISGLLISYHLINNNYKNQRINPVIIIFKRYMRIAVGLVYVIFFASTIFYHISNSALWDVFVGVEKDNCRSSWWQSLILISNFFESHHQCLMHTWYVYDDFLFFLMALAIISIYLKNNSLGLKVAAIVFVGSLIVPFMVSFLFRSAPFVRFLPDFIDELKSHEEFNYYYRKPYMRTASYLVGMLAGLAIYKFEEKKLKLNDVVFSLGKFSMLLLTCSSFVLLGCMLSGKIYYNPYYKYSKLESAIYGTFNRPIWALGTFGFVVAVGFGNFKWLQSVLSWQPLAILGKLTYGVYLWHFLLNIGKRAWNTHSRSLSFFILITEGTSDVVISFVLALLMYLLLEGPFESIINEFFQLIKRESKEEKSD